MTSLFIFELVDCETYCPRLRSFFIFELVDSVTTVLVRQCDKSLYIVLVDSVTSLFIFELADSVTSLFILSS